MNTMKEINLGNYMLEVLKKNMDYCDNPNNRIITECEIHRSEDGLENEVWIKSNCDGWAEDVKMLFAYFRDELYFTEREFIGLTEARAIKMFSDRIKAYFR